MRQYDWTRFWYSPDVPPSLSEDGFLHDPRSEFSGQPDGVLFTLSEVRDDPCLVLQGEPGIGKTTELELAVADACTAASNAGGDVLFLQLRDITSGEGLGTRLLGHPTYRAWREGDHHLTLFLDSLDEGLLGAETLASRLVGVLEEAPIGRLSFRLASRVADWPALLTDALAVRWGEARVRYLRLAPLREADVEAAARAEGLDADKFFAEVESRRVGPLAARPVTLRFLLNTYRARGTFPSSRAKLYHDGCLLLATEESKSRKAARRVGKLGAPERLAVAARIAFVLMFSNRSAVWTDADYGDIPASDVLLDACTGGTETAGGVRVVVRAPEIREVLDTALFSAHGEGRLGFSHQTYAEYLAAWYASAHRMTWRQLATLLVHPDDREARVVPQLRETAARLADLGRGIRQQMLQLDPEVVLASDVTSASSEHREALVDALIEQTRKHGVSTIPLRSLATLGHPGLSSQLGGVISNKREQAEARRLAIDITGACKVVGLSGLLASIALDRAEPFGVRVDAAFTVWRVGEEEGRRRLKELVTDESPHDEYDLLKGWALAAAWPQYITTTELFAALKPPKRDHFGPYEQFLRDMPADLEPADLVVALGWARPYAVEHGHLGESVTGILRRAWQHFDVDGVVERFAAIAHQRLLFGHHIIEDDDRPLGRRAEAAAFDGELAMQPDRRRTLFTALLRHVASASGKLHTLVYANHELVSPYDTAWLIDQVRGSGDEATKRVWAEVLWMVFVRSGLAVPLFELIYAAAIGEGADPVIRERFSDVLDPIDLDSPRARSLRDQAEELARWERKPRHERKGVPATSEQVVKYLTRFEGGDSDAWWHLCVYIGRNAEGTVLEPIYVDPTRQHGWQILDAATRARAIEAAHRYVLERSAEPEKWFEDKMDYWPAIAGYRALVLLQREDPKRLEAIPADVWRGWASILVAKPLYGSEEHSAPCRVVIGRAYRAAPDAVLEAFSAVIDQEDTERKSLFSLDRMQDCWDERFASALLEKVRRDQLSDNATEQLLTELVERGANGAEAYAGGLVRVPLAEAESERARILLAARLLLSTTSDAGREIVWPAMQRDPAFGREVILGLARNREWLIPQIEKRWPEDTIASLYIWLAEQFRPEEDPKPQGVFTPSPRYNVGDWRRRLRSALEHLGTKASVIALERIHVALPTPWHAEAVRNAKEATRRQTWSPPSPEQVIEIARGREKRLVRDGAELIRVVRESLDRFETEVQGETPLARTLWHPTGRGAWRPREEGELADAIQRHLQRDLADRGIVAGREVVIRRGAGKGVEGQRTDLYVYAVSRGESEDAFDTVSLIVEVKGSWHREVLTAMESQLLGSYLEKNQRCQHGLYVVGWYASPVWDKRDAGQRRSENLGDRRALDTMLCRQARALSARSGRTLRRMVLDISLGGAAVGRPRQRATNNAARTSELSRPARAAGAPPAAVMTRREDPVQSGSDDTQMGSSGKMPSG
jgi:hypothetical protein